jgi:hypothetical protein
MMTDVHFNFIKRLFKKEPPEDLTKGYTTEITVPKETMNNINRLADLSGGTVGSVFADALAIYAFLLGKVTDGSSEPINPQDLFEWRKDDD